MREGGGKGERRGCRSGGGDTRSWSRSRAVTRSHVALECCEKWLSYVLVTLDWNETNFFTAWNWNVADGTNATAVGWVGAVGV